MTGNVIEFRPPRGTPVDPAALVRAGRGSMSREAFAAALWAVLGWPVKPGMIRAWESGVPVPADVMEACRTRAFRDHALAGQTAAPPTAAQDKVGELADALNLAWGCAPAEVATVVTGLWKADIGRREVIASAWAVAALSEPLGRWLLDSPDRDVSRAGSRRVGRADVDAVWSMCSAFADADHRLGGGHARRALICYADEAVAPLLGGTYTDQIGRDLFAAAARLCDIAGFMCFDSDHQGLGQKYFIMALRMAKTSGDQGLGAHILTDMSMQAQHQRHSREAAALADAAVAAAARSGSATVLARCHAVRARALAAQGDASDSDHALNQAERALDRAVPRNEPFWITFFTKRQLAAEAMYSAAELGRASLVRRHAASVLRTLTACSAATSLPPPRSRPPICPAGTPRQIPPQTSSRPARYCAASCRKSAVRPVRERSAWSAQSAAA